MLTCLVLNFVIISFKVLVYLKYLCIVIILTAVCWCVMFVCQMKSIVSANDKVTSDVDPRFYLKYVSCYQGLYHVIQLLLKVI